MIEAQQLPDDPDWLLQLMSPSLCQLLSCLLSVAEINSTAKGNLGKEGFSSSYSTESIMKESQEWNSKQKPGGKN